MKYNLKQISITFMAGLFVVGGVILAGSINNSDAPDSTYISLNNIYEKLTTGATSTDKTFSPLASPASTMKTLTEVFEAIPDYLTFSDSTTTIPYGIYEATTLDTVDTDLIADNIADGVEIFGVTGNLEGAPADLVWSADMAGENTHTWQEGVDYCAGTVDGSTGWHLPYLWELLRFYQQNGQGDFTTYPYLSSTEDTFNPSEYFYYIFMHNGFFESTHRKTEASFAVRCAK